MSRKGFSIVTASPRCTTSLLMQLHSAAMPECVLNSGALDQRGERAFESEARSGAVGGIRPGTAEYAMQKALYMRTHNRKEELRDNLDSGMEHARNMNPEGFYETAFVSRGVHHTTDPLLQDAMTDVLNGETRVVKILGRGLAKTFPIFVRDLIIVFREPHIVTQSQQDILRVSPELGGGEMLPFHQMAPMTFPTVFIADFLAIIEYLVQNPETPFTAVNGDLLQSGSIPQLQRLDNHWKTKAFCDSSDKIKPSLKRSRGVQTSSDYRRLWEEAGILYSFLVELSFASENQPLTSRMLEKAKDIRDLFHSESCLYRAFDRQWFCPRRKRNTSITICHKCKSDGAFVQQMIRQSTMQQDPQPIWRSWEEECCPFECGIDPDMDPEEYLTEQQSIENNFWKEAVACRQQLS